MIIESVHVNAYPSYILYNLQKILAWKGFSIHLFLYTVIYDSIIYYRGVHGFDKNYPLVSLRVHRVQHLSWTPPKVDGGELTQVLLAPCMHDFLFIVCICIHNVYIMYIYLYVYNYIIHTHTRTPFISMKFLSWSIYIILYPIIYWWSTSQSTPRTRADHPTRPPRLPPLPRSICDSCVADWWSEILLGEIGHLTGHSCNSDDIQGDMPQLCRLVYRTANYRYTCRRL
jgi:hypothetical protein